MTRTVTELILPVYFLHGIYDYTISYNEAKSWFLMMRAPKKGLFSFEQSAHNPIFEEPERALKILLKDVLMVATDLADPIAEVA